MTPEDSAANQASAPDQGARNQGARNQGPTVRWLVAPVAVALIVLVTVLIIGLGTDDQQSDTSLAGKLAPAIVAPDLNGETFDLDRSRGRWVLVNFFATWCPPCRAEHPELIEFATTHGATGDASVVSVVFGDDPENVKQFFAENGGEWPVVDDVDGAISVDFGVISVPETFLIAPNGRVATRLLGGVTAETLDSVIAAFEGDDAGGGS